MLRLDSVSGYFEIECLFLPLPSLFSHPPPYRSHYLMNISPFLSLFLHLHLQSLSLRIIQSECNGSSYDMIMVTYSDRFRGWGAPLPHFQFHTSLDHTTRFSTPTLGAVCLASSVKSLAAPTHVHSYTGGLETNPEAENIDSGFHSFGVGEKRSNHYTVSDCYYRRSPRLLKARRCTRHVSSVTSFTEPAGSRLLGNKR